jgi:hypothetical protein
MNWRRLRSWSGKGLLAAMLVLLISAWTIISNKVVEVPMSNGGTCRWQLNQWYNGRCVLSYYEGAACKGVVRTRKGLFEWPVAIFAGPDAHSVICLYELDTTVAVFTIELSKQSSEGIPPPQRLQDLVLHSNFRTRACTKAEVTYLRNHISSTKDPLWRNAFAIFGSKVDPEQGRQGLLRTLDMGTIPYEERDPTWRDYSKPQIQPED